MEVKCDVKDCRYNKTNKCTRNEIEVMKISAYDEDSAECLNYLSAMEG